MQPITLALLAISATLPALTSAAFNESDVALATRRVWCRAQTSQCPALCADQDKDWEVNDCDAETLSYSCICDDGLRPNLTEYSETIPYYICVNQQQACIEDCGSGGNDCAEQCKKTFVCGATHPRSSNKTSASSTSGASPTSTGSAEDDDGEGFASTSGDGDDEEEDNAAGALLLQVGKAYGMGIVAAGVALGAALL